MITSIRRFLVIVLLAVITLFNFIAALQSYLAGMEKAEQLFDEQLKDITHLLSHSGSGSITTEIVLSDKKDNIAFQIWSDRKQLLQRSDNMPEESLTPFRDGFSYASYGGFRWRTYTQRNNASKQWIIIAERTDIRYTLAEDVILTSVLPIVLGLPILGLLIWLIIGSGLKPLKQLASELGQKKSGDLRPLATDNTPKELAQLVESTNGLLYRLSESFEREKRFSDDAAHELRTPLSALKIHLYNLAEQVPKDDESLQLLNTSIDRMTHLIDQMLILYRTTPDQFVANFQIVDLHTIVQNVVSEQYQNISDKNQIIELEGYSCVLTGDKFALEILVKNLIDNANKYTPDNGAVKVSLFSDKAKVVLVVEDSGIGICEDLYDRVFERFYRVNGDQHNSNVVGCGLGFSIIKHIVELHQGSTSLGESVFDSGLKVTITLPIKLDS